MIYRIEDALPVLRRTPDVVAALLDGLPDVWLYAIEGPGTWSPFDVLGHLIHGEKTDWMPRVEHLLAHGEALAFPVFDREAMFIASRGRKAADLLDEFAALRRASLERLEVLHLTDADLERRGLHPELGRVTLGQHLATWVAHDMGHVSQMVRVMGRQYTDEVGPWRAYLSMLRPPSTGPLTGA
jgi:hypothetical protein